VAYGLAVCGCVSERATAAAGALCARLLASTSATATAAAAVTVQMAAAALTETSRDLESAAAAAAVEVVGAVVAASAGDTPSTQAMLPGTTRPPQS